jgi:CSLREA domain-containing protein
MGGTIPLLGFVLTALLGTSLLLAAVPAHAAKTFTVNSNLDSADPSGGVCDALATWGEQCTLRAAVQEANHPTNLGADRIGFNIGGGIGVKTGSPRSELPADNRAAAINGYTQPGAAGNTDAGPGKTRARPLAELEGTNVAQLPVGGLDVRAANVVVRGLVINRFPFDGSDVRANADGLEPAGAAIEGNLIGTDAGREDLGNGTTGVLLV